MTEKREKCLCNFFGFSLNCIDARIDFVWPLVKSNLDRGYGDKPFPVAHLDACWKTVSCRQLAREVGADDLDVVTRSARMNGRNNLTILVNFHYFASPAGIGDDFEANHGPPLLLV